MHQLRAQCILRGAALLWFVRAPPGRRRRRRCAQLRLLSRVIPAHRSALCAPSSCVVSRKRRVRGGPSFCVPAASAPILRRRVPSRPVAAAPGPHARTRARTQRKKPCRGRTQARGRRSSERAPLACVRVTSVRTFPSSRWGGGARRGGHVRSAPQRRAAPPARGPARGAPRARVRRRAASPRRRRAHAAAAPPLIPPRAAGLLRVATKVPCAAASPPRLSPPSFSRRAPAPPSVRRSRRLARAIRA
jgi:hypothetical protein